MKEIPLSRNKFAIVDDEDFDFLSLPTYKWHAIENKKTFYAGGRKNIKMHTLLMNTPEGKIVDHINGNGLDNRKENLRICTVEENNRNRGKTVRNKSGFKGVCYLKNTKKWKASIRVSKKQINIGYFKTKEEAYEAYCVACVKYHGEFSNLG
jgi:hypothetical protein